MFRRRPKRHSDAVQVRFEGLLASVTGAIKAFVTGAIKASVTGAIKASVTGAIKASVTGVIQALSQVQSHAAFRLPPGVV
ncbi:hypothetical protein VitviT2T_013929 [Vitis vinifera]|uniref:Uncharacterized protein n=1 Tax=Vitis vinifera TaxID=29760 RepID=A0ABY9CKN6_VITVI|nr:hypothetical protein VitviT2T_013929 [Vitis vinifera]